MHFVPEVDATDPERPQKVVRPMRKSSTTGFSYPALTMASIGLRLKRGGRNDLGICGGAGSP